VNPGEILDNRYEIVSRLGAGGMGEVYKAVHTHLGAPRVIKVIHSNISSSDDAKDRFLREARTATKVHHPNVATLHDFSSLPDGAHYMVWEYIDGENLAQRLRAKGTLPPRQAIHIIQQALSGLDAIHRAGIVHRDISPENLMITADDQLKIIDMGVAKVEDAGAVSQTRTGIFVGKLRYAAPEQLGFIPDGEKLDGRADIYAMAMVLFELLTGRPPYEAKSPHEYFMLHARPQQDKILELPPHIVGAAALQEVLTKALARDRNQRYNTAREFASALELVELRLPTEVDELTVAIPSQTDATTRLSQTPLPGRTSPATSITQQKTAPHTAPGALPPPPQGSIPTLLTPVPQNQPLAATQQAAFAQQLPTQQASFPQQAPKQGSMMPLLVIGLVLLLIAGAVAGVMLWPFGGRQDVPEITDTTNTTTGSQTTTQPAQTASSSVTVTSGTTDPTLNSALPPVTTTSPTATIVENTQTVPPVVTQTVPPVVTQTVAPREEPRTPPRRTETVAETPVPTTTTRASDDDDTSRAGLSSAPRYVDGGDEDENERAMESLRRALRGTKAMSLRGGAMRDELYRAMRDQLPDMDFEGEADVIVRFEGTMERRGRAGLKRRAGSGTVTKNGRVVFRYELAPEDYRVGDTAAEAFARVIANAVE
jgi:serine/threonine protein kinase